MRRSRSRRDISHELRAQNVREQEERIRSRLQEVQKEIAEIKAKIADNSAVVSTYVKRLATELQGDVKEIKDLIQTHADELDDVEHPEIKIKHIEPVCSVCVLCLQPE